MLRPKFTAKFLTCLGLMLAALSFNVTIPPTFATEEPEKVPQQADIIERLGNTIDLSIPFTDQSGKQLPLAEIIGQKPIILVPVYYRCPRLCNYTLNGVLEMVKQQKLILGEEYKIVTFSINPDETHKLANSKAENYYNELEDPEAGRAGWHFLAGEQQSITKLTKEVGFSYAKDGEEYSHAAVAIIVGPEGQISRYFYGINYSARDLRLSLIEAADGKIGSTGDKLLLFCFRFDPTQGKYTLAILEVVRIFCLACVAVLFVSLLVLKIQEKRGSRNA